MSIGSAIRLLEQHGFQVVAPLIRKCALPDCAIEFVVPRKRGTKRKYCNEKCSREAFRRESVTRAREWRERNK